MHLKGGMALQRLEAAEKAKIELSSSDQTEINLILLLIAQVQNILFIRLRELNLNL